MKLCAKCESAAACHRDDACILEWAEKLAADSVACGEAEYGPDYPSNRTTDSSCVVSPTPDRQEP